MAHNMGSGFGNDFDADMVQMILEASAVAFVWILTKELSCCHTSLNYQVIVMRVVVP